MVLFSIPDIRLFWSQDSRFSSQFKAGEISTFKPYSKYPECYKDLAFWLPGNLTEGAGAGGKGEAATKWHENDFMELVRDEAGDLIEGVDLVSWNRFTFSLPEYQD
jgi:phenylalanyl-tRNA synthetase alpha chain